MGILDDFKPERKVEWDDIAATIHEAVTMDDVIRQYAPQLPTRNHRAPCPIHNGKDYNFSYTRNGYKCFVCGASGDVISFVKAVCELATRADAMKRISNDFGLNLSINSTLSAIQSANLALRRAEREKKDIEHKAWETEYNLLWDEWVRLDKAKRTADPDSDEYADAVKRIDYISYRIDCLKAEPR